MCSDVCAEALLGADWAAGNFNGRRKSVVDVEHALTSMYTEAPNWVISTTPMSIFVYFNQKGEMNPTRESEPREAASSSSSSASSPVVEPATDTG